MGDLNKKQVLFCKEYVLDHNATNAARRSGYSARSAKNQGSRLMTNDDILEEIKRLEYSALEKADLKKEDIVKELARGAFANIDPSQIKFSDKLKCLELLGKYFAMFDGKAAPEPDDGEKAKVRLLEAVRRLSL